MDPEPGLAQRLFDIYSDVVDRTVAATTGHPKANDAAAMSIDNLLAYAALRSHDLAAMQHELAWEGLSSLGRLEGAVIWNLERVLAWLDMPSRAPELRCPTPEEARQLLAERSRALLGRPRRARSTRVMVTVDAATLAEGDRIAQLIAEKVDAIRINTAHDGPDDWAAIIAAVRDAEASMEREGHPPSRRCRVFMDLAGPKIRTGPIVPRPGTIELRPVPAKNGHPKELRGCLVPGREWSMVEHAGHHTCRFSLAMAPGIQPSDLSPGEVLEFRDADGKRRQLTVVATTAQQAQLRLLKRARLAGVTKVRTSGGATFELQPPPPTEGWVALAAGDPLRVYRDPHRPGRPAADGAVASLSCTDPRALAGVDVGHRIAIDDGRLWARVVAVTREHIDAEVFAPDQPTRVRAEKGMNLPDSPVGLPAITDEDRANLPFIAQHADAVGLSFAQRPEDICELRQALNALGATDVGIVAKVETSAAVHNLGRILAAGVSCQPFGVMIARGDLAVEVGFENLAQLQEEILCLCEAAHTPVIWATQVLESLAKGGLPARSEITDAAMGQRAECVMLNKGPHILEAVRTLESLLAREERHRVKKRQIFREFPEQLGLLTADAALAVAT